MTTITDFIKASDEPHRYFLHYQFSCCVVKFNIFCDPTLTMVKNPWDYVLQKIIHGSIHTFLFWSSYYYGNWITHRIIHSQFQCCISNSCCNSIEFYDSFIFLNVSAQISTSSREMLRVEPFRSIVNYWFPYFPSGLFLLIPRTNFRFCFMFTK